MGKLPLAQEALEEAKEHCRYCRSRILDQSSISTVPKQDRGLFCPKREPSLRRFRSGMGPTSKGFIEGLGETFWSPCNFPTGLAKSIDERLVLRRERRV